MTRPNVVLGLTGSIGMGKSTTLRMFRAAGAEIWDADASVHRIYAPGGAGGPALASLAPQAVVDGAVDRQTLRALIMNDPDLLPRIEQAIHPLVVADREAFLASCAAPVAVCDIPLLYETGVSAEFDAVVLVTASPETQRKRVMARPGMTEEVFERILSRQVPDADKRARADYVIDTDLGLAAAEAKVAAIMKKATTGYA